jgi:glycerol-3-phosphate cytidylyltransferase
MPEKPRVGYTTGVFDMFHVGHLNILRKAKESCDKLIVGVCTDELVGELKGRESVIPFEERVEIIRNIKFVDEVVPQKKIDEIGDYHRIHFDVMFKGDDWEGTEKWNRLEEEFKGLGVEVMYFPYTKHVSSTKLRKIIDNLELE